MIKSILGAIFRPNFVLIAILGVGILGFSGFFNSNSSPINCQTTTCAKASEILKSDQFWQKNTSSLNLASFSIPWKSDNSTFDKELQDLDKKTNENSTKKSENNFQITQITGDLYQKQKTEYHQKVLFLLENLNQTKREKLCELNFNFVIETQDEAKIQAICQKLNQNKSVQGANSEIKNQNNKIFVIPTDFLD